MEATVDPVAQKHQFNLAFLDLLMLCEFISSSFYPGSEDLSDDITQQQLLPGVKYVEIFRYGFVDIDV